MKPGTTQIFQNVVTPPTGILASNQCKYFSQSIAASSSTTVSLVAASDNIASNAVATFDKLQGGIFWLPRITDIPALSLTVQASSVTVGISATNGNDLFMGNSSSTLTLVPGRSIAWLDQVSTIAVSAGATSITFTNNDASNTATPVVFLIGLDN